MTNPGKLIKVLTAIKDIVELLKKISFKYIILFLDCFLISEIFGFFNVLNFSKFNLIVLTSVVNLCLILYALVFLITRSQVVRTSFKNTIDKFFNHIEINKMNKFVDAKWFINYLTEGKINPVTSCDLRTKKNEKPVRCYHTRKKKNGKEEEVRCEYEYCRIIPKFKYNTKSLSAKAQKKLRPLINNKIRGCKDISYCGTCICVDSSTKKKNVFECSLNIKKWSVLSVDFEINVDDVKCEISAIDSIVINVPFFSFLFPKNYNITFNVEKCIPERRMLITNLEDKRKIRKKNVSFDINKNAITNDFFKSEQSIENFYFCRG